MVARQHELLLNRALVARVAHRSTERVLRFPLPSIRQRVVPILVPIGSRTAYRKIDTFKFQV